MSNPKLLRYAVIALTAAVVVVVLVWRDNPLDSDVDTAAPPPATVDVTTTSESTVTTEDDATSSTSSSSTSTSTTSSTTTTTTTTTSTTAPASTEVPEVDWPSVPDSGEPAAVVTGSGVILPVTSGSGGTYEAISPCGNPVTVEGEALYGANIVIDPGHGGPDRGATATNGLREKNINLYVAQAAASMLERAGATVVVTRSDDYEMLLETRAELAVRLDPDLFISVYHNDDADGRSDTPGSETYFQVNSSDSKRAAGLIYEELIEAFEDYDANWVADRDAGAKSRVAEDGGDYLGILRLSAGVPAVVTAALFLDNPSEAELLRDPSVLDAEARAISEGAQRYVGSSDPGSGFVQAYPRKDEPAGPPGPPCEDPPLG